MDSLKKPGGEEDRWQNDKLRNAPWKACMALTARWPVLLCGRTTKAWAVKPLIKKPHQGMMWSRFVRPRANTIACPAWFEKPGTRRKKKMQGFVWFFFHAELLKSLPYISVAGPWRKHNTGSLFIPLDVSVLILKVNAHSGQRELNPCCHVTMKSKLWGIVQVTL